MASPQTAAPLLTAEEFHQLPDPEEGGKLELIDGEVFYEIPASSGHGDLAGLLIIRLGSFSLENGLGKVVPEVGFRLRRNPDTVRAPDVAYISHATIQARGWPREGFVDYPPDLAIEVISPSNLDSEVALKVEHYIEAGVPRVWVVRPRTQTVTVHYPDHTARTLLIGSVLTSDDAGFATAGFALALEALFANQ